MKLGAPRALLLLITACGERHPAPASEGPDASTPPAVPIAAVPPPAAAAPAPTPSRDPVEAALADGRLVALAPAGQAGSFEATLAARDRTETQPARLTIALTNAQSIHRRALAFYRLSRALGSDLVPAVVLRPIGVGELAALLQDRREAVDLIRTRAAIQNDGTVDAVLRPRLPAGGREVSLDGYEAVTWGRWAASAAPVAGEDRALLRAYIETLVLDYLSGNVLRRGVWLDAGGVLRLIESPLAFPLHTDAGALDRTLRQLREVARFPRGLGAALRKLDRAGARAVFCPGEFETWLLPPRSLVELDERRAGLLTLIEARVMERGVDSVLSL